MFISIPKEVFSTVIFGEKFILNLENNHMEYDTGREELIIGGNRYLRKDPTEGAIKGQGKGKGKGPVEDFVKGSPEYLTEEAEEKAKVEKEINEDKANDNEMLSEADEEFIHMKSVEL